jgi:hypothetical protein
LRKSFRQPSPRPPPARDPNPHRYRRCSWPVTGSSRAHRKSHPPFHKQCLGHLVQSA